MSGTPPTELPARTAASDEHHISTRAARSAGLNFAVILLSKAIDAERDHLIHRKRSPFPYEGKDLMRRTVGETYNVGREHFECPASETMQPCRTAGECSPSLNPAGRSPSPPGIGMPAALWGDVGGVPR